MPPKGYRKKDAVARALMDIPDVEASIRAELPMLIQRMMDLANGVCVLESKQDPVTGEWSQRVYKTAPDRQALQFLIENVIGKTPQRIEMTGKDGGPMKIVPWMPVAEAREQGLVIDGEAREVSRLNIGIEKETSVTA